MFTITREREFEITSFILNNKLLYVPLIYNAEAKGFEPLGPFTARRFSLLHYVSIAKQKQRDLTYTAQLPFNLIFFVCCSLDSI